MVIANRLTPKSDLGKAEEALGGLRIRRLLPLILFEPRALDAPGSFFMCLALWSDAAEYQTTAHLQLVHPARHSS